MSIHLPQWMYCQDLCRNQAVVSRIYTVATILIQVLGRDVVVSTSTCTAQEPREYKALVDVAGLIFHYWEEITLSNGTQSPFCPCPFQIA